MTKYIFKTEPYKHQREVLKKSWNSRFYGLFMEMGTGKSKVAIDTIGILFSQRFLDSALIIAPKGVYDNWCSKELLQHLSDDIECQIVRWSPSKSQKFNRELDTFVAKKSDKLKIFVMNVEAFSTARGTEAAQAFLTMNPENIVIVDESSTIKNRKAARTKNIMSLRPLSKYRRILTGSPITKSPMDLFSQCNFLNKECLGFSSYYAFQARYANIQRRSVGHRSFQQISSYKRLDELSEKLDHFSHRVLKKDCLDLPEKVYTRREIELTKEQLSAYTQMQKLALTMLEGGELSTTASVLTQIMRLQQICCGHLTTDEGVVRELRSNRLESLLDLVDEIEGKAIIWANYTHDLLAIEKALKKKFDEPKVAATFYGATPQEKRQQIVNNFQDVNNPLRFFVGQPKTGGFGLTLTEATTVIYFSNSYDLEIRLQSEDRAHRIGQTNKVTYVDFVSPKTIDEKILNALRDKISLAGQVLKEDVASWLTY